MVLTDLAAMGVGFFLVTRVAGYGQHRTEGLVSTVALGSGAWTAAFAGFGLYAPQRLAPIEEFRRVVAAVGVAITSIVAMSFWLHGSIARWWVALAWAISLATVLLSRKAWRMAIRSAWGHGRLALRTLVVGTSPQAASLAHAMLDVPAGYAPVGFIGRPSLATSDAGLPVLGDVRDLAAVIHADGAECIFVASHALDATEMREVSSVARRQAVEFRLLSNLPDMLATRVTAQPVAGVMALSVRPVRLSGPQQALKRTFDLVVAGLLIVVTLPLWLGPALAVKLDTPGPVLFRQKRVGRHGREFELLKFRTMVVGADAMLEDLREGNESDGPLFKMTHDPRVTRVGHHLRRWSVDELPQLLNVLRGEMSLVGPRPALPTEALAWQDWHFERLEVRPGITGLWQVNGRAELSFDDYVRLDLYYIDNWSLAYDLYVLARTPSAVLCGRGAH